MSEVSEHIMVQTLSCGEIVAPLSNITLHKVGATYRMLLRDDTDWREISGESYGTLLGLTDYVSI